MEIEIDNVNDKNYGLHREQIHNEAKISSKYLNLMKNNSKENR